MSKLLDEYEAVRRRAGVIDASFLGAIRVVGADRVTFLHHLLTQDIKGLKPTTAATAALVTPAGKLVSDMVVWADMEAHWLLPPRARIHAVIEGLEHYVITEDVALEDRTAAQPVLALQGPASHELMKGANARAVSYSLTGSPGLLIMAPATLPDVPRVGTPTLNVLRIEAGIPWFGVDMDESNLLPETGLQARAVSDTKGCYVGQEIIARMATYGSASRKLMGLVFEGPGIPQPGDAILKDAETVGAVTSACFSPALTKPIALGYVKRPYDQPGTSVGVVRNGQAMPATLAQLPFQTLFGLKVSDTSV